MDWFVFVLWGLTCAAIWMLFALSPIGILFCALVTIPYTVELIRVAKKRAL